MTPQKLSSIYKIDESLQKNKYKFKNILLNILENLIKAKIGYDQPPKYESALRANQLLWTAIQQIIIENKIAISNLEKANLISISIFVDGQTAMALADPPGEHLDNLIEINRTMMSALN